jgi:hypothetical protein
LGLRLSKDTRLQRVRFLLHPQIQFIHVQRYNRSQLTFDCRVRLSTSNNYTFYSIIYSLWNWTERCWPAALDRSSLLRARGSASGIPQGPKKSFDDEESGEHLSVLRTCLDLFSKQDPGLTNHVRGLRI